MSLKNSLIISLSLILLTTQCKNANDPVQEVEVQNEVDVEVERKAILETLNNETKAAFQRDYEAWKGHWVHDPDITKTYIDFHENTFSESVGWNEISEFVRTFIEAHPEPEPLPKLLDNIDVRLYGNGAWVTYEQQDSIRGLKRETRLMEKVNGKWKIAGMQTTIYGFESDKHLK